MGVDTCKAIRPRLPLLQRSFTGQRQNLGSAASSTAGPRPCSQVGRQQYEPMTADAKVALVGGALLIFGGSITSVYVALTHDPNRKDDRAGLRRGEYIAGASVIGAVGLVIFAM